jgi:hypothetical protein
MDTIYQNPDTIRQIRRMRENSKGNRERDVAMLSAAAAFLITASPRAGLRGTVSNYTIKGKDLSSFFKKASS